MGYAVPLLDARRGQVYTSLYAASGSEWSRLGPDQIRLMADWAQELRDVLEGTSPEMRPAYLLLTGDLERHAEAIDELETNLAGLAGGAPELIRQPHTVDGPSVAWLGSRRLAGGEADDAHAFVPNYAQLAEAEVKLLEKEA